MPTRRHFTPATFAFLRDLAANNDRGWFAANQDRYESAVREPALDFIEDFAGPLAEISDHFSADPRKSGGSLFRIQRDVRFSKDKSPYKGNTGMHFRHVAARDVHAPGFYLHLEPRASFAGVGIWHPETAVANRIRRAIVDDPGAWTTATRSTRFTAVWTLGGESLQRPPRGFDPDHPLLEDLKRKDFIASARLTQKQVTSAGFLNEYGAMCRTAAPFMRFLCGALGVGF
jgi:uncharacterized protein (TIGR02453 family)